MGTLGLLISEEQADLCLIDNPGFLSRRYGCEQLFGDSLHNYAA